MRMLQLTVKGWPDKKDENMTRILFPASCQTSSDTVSAIMGKLGGLFWMEARVVEEGPERDEAELARVHQILSTFAGAPHTH